MTIDEGSQTALNEFKKCVHRTFNEFIRTKQGTTT